MSNSNERRIANGWIRLCMGVCMSLSLSPSPLLARSMSSARNSRESMDFPYFLGIGRRGLSGCAATGTGGASGSVSVTVAPIGVSS